MTTFRFGLGLIINYFRAGSLPGFPAQALPIAVAAT